VSNVGGIVRVIRFLLGVILILFPAGHVVTGKPAIVACVVGDIVLVAALVRYCPAWTLLGINTCALKAGQGK